MASKSIRDKYRKALAGKMKDESDAQASWGNKVRAPMNREGSIANKARWQSAKGASGSTLATRAKYISAKRKGK